MHAAARIVDVVAVAPDHVHVQLHHGLPSEDARVDADASAVGTEPRIELRRPYTDHRHSFRPRTRIHVGAIARERAGGSRAASGSARSGFEAALGRQGRTRARS